MPTKNERLRNLERRIRVDQSRDRRRLQGAIVGRPIVQSGLNAVNRELHRPLPYANFRCAGHLAVVYVFNDELRQQQGLTYFNARQVERAIDLAAPTVTKPISVERGLLRLVERGSIPDFGMNKYWVKAQVTDARSIDSGQSVRLSREELGIANDLFSENNNEVGPAPLWLGGLDAPERFEQAELLESLEVAMPTRFEAKPVQLVYAHK